MTVLLAIFLALGRYHQFNLSWRASVEVHPLAENVVFEVWIGPAAEEGGRRVRHNNFNFTSEKIFIVNCTEYRYVKLMDQWAWYSEHQQWRTHSIVFDGNDGGSEVVNFATAPPSSVMTNKCISFCHSVNMNQSELSISPSQPIRDLAPACWQLLSTGLSWNFLQVDMRGVCGLHLAPTSHILLIAINCRPEFNTNLVTISPTYICV